MNIGFSRTTFFARENGPDPNSGPSRSIRFAQGKLQFDELSEAAR